MPAARTRVVPPFPVSNRRVVALAVAAGVVHAVGVALMNAAGWDVWVPNSGLPAPLRPVMFILPVLVPAFLAAMVLARRTPRLGLVVRGMAAMMAAFAVTSGVVSMLHFRSPAQLQTWMQLEWRMMVLLVLAMLLGAICALVAAWVTRTFLFVVVEQTGTLCWRCGYDRGSGGIAVCPECGTPAEPAVVRGGGWVRLFDSLAKRGRVALALLVTGLLVWSGQQVSGRILPTVRFYERFREQSVPAVAASAPWCWLYVPPGKNPSGLWDGAAACVPFEDDPTHGLIVAYWPTGPGNCRTDVRMRIQYAQMPQAVVVPAGAGPIAYPDEGSTRVYADLRAEQARSIVETGRVPPKLAEALRRRAAEINWNVPPGGVVGLRPVPESAVEASEYLE